MEKRDDKRSRSPSFDFDQWCELAGNDPQEFERRRRALLDDFIASAPPRMRERLTRLQWRIDMERKRSKTPMKACVKIYEMMWDQIHADRGFLYAVNLLRNVVKGEAPGEQPGTGVETRVFSISEGRSVAAEAHL